MGRVALSAVLFAAAVASILVGLSGDPCRGADDWALSLYATGPSVGAGVFVALYQRLRVKWVVLCALGIATAAGAGAVFLGLVRWAENCTN